MNEESKLKTIKLTELNSLLGSIDHLYYLCA